MQEYISAVRVLRNVIEHGRSLDASFKPGDSPLSRQICFGVLRHYYWLKETVQQLVTKPLPAKHLDIELLIMAGIYSIEDLKRPDHASVNAAVNTTTRLRKAWARGLVNGVLRQYQRDASSLTPASEESQTNHPAWLCNYLNRAYPGQFEDIILANNQHPPMTLRVNTQKISRDTYLEKLSAEGISASAGKLAVTAIYLESPKPVSELPEFENGFVSVQDEASQLVPNVMGLRGDETVLDACAAPGGKTCHLLEHWPDVSLTATDKDPDRTNIIRENLDRLDLNCAVVSKDLLEFADGSFDAILLDAPCSATGIIRRHPDIKLLRKESDIAKLASAQLELLAKAFSLLTTNGHLVYTTCSILPEENEQIVKQFVEQNPEAELVPIKAEWGIETAHGRQLLPTIDGPDGFFFSHLRKRQVAA